MTAAADRCLHACQQPRRHPGPHLRRAALAGLALLLGACGTLRSARLLAPEAYGMEPAAPGLYVEPVMDAAQRQALRQQVALGRAQVERFFGSLTTTPTIVACTTPECSARFGSLGDRASAIGERAILLTHRGLGAALVAHEWTHAEVWHRVGGWPAAERLPRWFDEGLAVVVADEPRHAEHNWREIQRRGLATPPLDALVTRSAWIAAVKAYGETEGDGPDNLRRVYSTAGHALRGWLACAGAPGVLALLQAVRGGQAFDAAQAQAGQAAGCPPVSGAGLAGVLGELSADQGAQRPSRCTTMASP